MQLQTKKIIAREFLLLILSMAIALVVFGGTYLYNFIQEKRVQKIEVQISAKKLLVDSLGSGIILEKRNQRNWFYNANRKYYGDLTIDSFWNLMQLRRDSFVIRYHKIYTPELKSFLTSLGFETPEKLRDFVVSNLFNEKDFAIIRKQQIIEKEIKKLEKEKIEITEISQQEAKQISNWTFVISIIVLFLLRYLFYGIRWSLKTLKQE
ncbi:MAG: hypothetical protein RJA07_1873 [Bacteroidota bacterium]|jgi:transposase